MTIMAELRANVLSCEGITHLLSWEGSHPPGLDKLPCTPRSISTAFIEATATIHGPRAKKCKSCAKPAPPGDLTVTVQVTDLP